MNAAGLSHPLDGIRSTSDTRTAAPLPLWTWVVAALALGAAILGLISIL